MLDELDIPVVVIYSKEEKIRLTEMEEIVKL